MASSLDTQRLKLLFQSRPDLLEGIQQAADSPARIKLFNGIADFVLQQLDDQQSSEPSQKRRRVDIAPSQKGPSTSQVNKKSPQDVGEEAVLLEIKDISVAVPQRKKLDLCFTKEHLYARTPGTTAPLPGIIYAWSDIRYAFYLTMPEKSQIQHSYILFPEDSFLTPKNGAPVVEPLVFAVADGAPKPGTVGGPNAEAASAVSDTYSHLFHWAIKKCLQVGGNNRVPITTADPAKFHSVVRQPHRPNVQAVHVKAHRGTKDGFLFFLENGILWGFKKPLMFIPMHKIAAVSYTNVLQRTFSMVVEVWTGEGEDLDGTEEIEFSWIDQEDYAGINETYVTRHRLQDRSMADQRKAKRELLENAKGQKGANGDEQGANGDAGEGSMTELQKAHLEAEQQLQDEEDEDEEDYDPGSDAETDGSGSSSEDDDDDDEAEDEDAEEDD
ncbi:hypothetical protein GGR56DRAFT_673086 [Xylariaceae sp. FL0804]|nr:hypothetical protein GGR56DRAFT_673086 [Xylariaceae sp. FL0804]